MHPTALMNCERFFQCYLNKFDCNRNITIIEIGSQDVNGSLRSIAPKDSKYIGVDFVAGKGVDLVLDSPYELPFADNSIDIILSSSCFEHAEMYWLVFLEIMRSLKPEGLFYLNAPSNGVYHRFPVDCWRFFPDSGKALITWARKNKLNTALLESYVSNQHIHEWNDFVGIFLKDENHASKYPNRVIDTFHDFRNGHKYGCTEILKHSDLTEDREKIISIKNGTNT